MLEQVALGVEAARSLRLQENLNLLEAEVGTLQQQMEQSLKSNLKAKRAANSSQQPQDDLHARLSQAEKRLNNMMQQFKTMRVRSHDVHF